MSGRWFLFVLAACAAVAAGGAASPGLAADERATPVEEARDLTALSLDELLDVRIPSVYAASRYEQKVTSAPASVTIVTRDEIETRGYRTLAEVLESVRGFYTSDDRNYTYIGVRGFGRPGDYNSRVLLLVDGHRINDDIYNAAYFAHDFILDLDLVDHVEIVRGPGSALYGTSAFFAVVNVVTQRTSEAKGAFVSAAGGSHGAVQGGLRYAWESTGGVGVLLSASRYHSPGQRLFFEEYDDRSTHDGVARDADEERAQSAFGRVTWRGFSAQGAFVSRKKEIPTGSYLTVFGDPRSVSLDERGYLDVGYDGTLGGSVNLSAHLYYDRYYYRGNYFYAPPPNINSDRAAGVWVGLDDRLTFPVGDRHVLTCGTELQVDLRQDMRNNDVDPYLSRLDSKNRSHLWAAYVQDEATFSAQWSVIAGVRYDRYETFGSTTNPRLALLYHPAPGQVIKGLYGQAFRAPSAYELYYGSPLFLGQKTNPDLSPETIATSEITYDGWFRGGLHAGASAYRYNIEDLISLTRDPLDGRVVFRNVERVRSHGLEAVIEKRWNSGWAARANGTFQDSRDLATRRRLSNSPRWLGRAGLTAPLGERVLADLEVQYTGPRKTIGAGHAAGFAIANLTVSTRRLASGLVLTAGAYNVLDRSVTDPASNEHLQEVIPQDGRTFRLKLSYAF